MARRPYVIGLTGNIACGKTLVLRELAALGAETIDADEVARTLVQPGSPVLAKIVEAFGPSILLPDGSLDRRPVIVAEIRRRIAETERPVFVIDAIKLFESSLARDCDEVWVVTCTPEQQLTRLMSRNGLSEEEALVRIRAQPPQEEKIARADRVIDNSGTIDETRRQVRKLWQEVLRKLGYPQPSSLADRDVSPYTAGERTDQTERRDDRDGTAETEPDAGGSPRPAP